MLFILVFIAVSKPAKIVCRLTGTNVTNLDKQALAKHLLFLNVEKYSFDTNKRILLSTITYIK